MAKAYREAFDCILLICFKNLNFKQISFNPLQRNLEKLLNFRWEIWIIKKNIYPKMKKKNSSIKLTDVYLR